MKGAGCVSGSVKETRVGFHRLLFGGCGSVPMLSEVTTSQSLHKEFEF